MLRLTNGSRLPFHAVTGGSPPDRAGPDIGRAFVALDRRLADLRDQLTGLSEDPAPATPLSRPPLRRPLAEPTPPAPGAEPDPAPVPTDQMPAPAAAAQDPAPSEQEDPAPSDGGPEPTRAEEAARVESLEQLAVQIEQLLTVRDQLLADARELVRAFERRLDELEDQGTISVTVSPPPARPVFVEGTVTLAVQGASRIKTIEVLEDSLARIPQVEETYIRRWHAGRLWIELSLSGGVELLGELGRVLPFPFDVQSAAGGEISVAVEEAG